MKYKKLSEKHKLSIEYQIIRLILAGGDWCINVDKDYSTWWRSPNNPYFAEAFGIIQALRCLDYGYIGAVNTTEDYNLQAIFERCKDSAIYLMGNYGPKEIYFRVAYDINIPFGCDCVDASKGETFDKNFVKGFYKKR